MKREDYIRLQCRISNSIQEAVDEIVEKEMHSWPAKELFKKYLTYCGNSEIGDNLAQCYIENSDILRLEDLVAFIEIVAKHYGDFSPKEIAEMIAQDIG